jgi:hypothetical protein
MEMEIINFVKPELLILIPVLYILGIVLKGTTLIKDKYIPLVLILIGILLATLWVLATTQLSSKQIVFMAIFVAITQGTLVSCGAVGINQAFVVQPNKRE